MQEQQPPKSAEKRVEFMDISFNTLSSLDRCLILLAVAMMTRRLCRAVALV